MYHPFIVIYLIISVYYRNLRCFNRWQLYILLNNVSYFGWSLTNHWLRALFPIKHDCRGLNCHFNLLEISSVLRHKAGQEGRGEILLENSFMRWRCHQGKIMHTTSKNFSVLYVLRKHQQHINIQWHHLRCYFWHIDHPILGQVATLRSFQLESILECPALDVRQLVRNKRRKEYDSHIT